MYYYPYSYYYDPTYILVIIGAIFTFVVQIYMQSTFNKYNKISSKKNITASEVAKLILIKNGINNVDVGMTPGNLTDHYAPLTKTLNLSYTTYNSTSIASIGVAAHECGHAIQDYKKDVLLNLQMSIVPVVNVATTISGPIILIGLIIGAMGLFKIGIILFSATLIYYLLTLPIEFGASNNALKTLKEYNILNDDELYGAKKVLTAAALTYVAAFANSLLQVVRFILISKRNSRD